MVKIGGFKHATGWSPPRKTYERNRALLGEMNDLYVIYDITAKGTFSSVTSRINR